MTFSDYLNIFVIFVLAPDMVVRLVEIRRQSALSQRLEDIERCIWPSRFKVKA